MPTPIHSTQSVPKARPILRSSCQAANDGPDSQGDSVPNPPPLLAPQHAALLANIDATDEQKRALVQILETLCRHVLETCWREAIQARETPE